MSIVNRRNAMIGWLTWTVAKQMASQKAKAVVPSRGGGSGSRKGVALKAGAAAAAVAGVIVFWRVRHRDSTDHDSFAAEELDEPTVE
jgi:hypothetical protein